jgi:hypothetical protein
MFPRTSQIIENDSQKDTGKHTHHKNMKTHNIAKQKRKNVYLLRFRHIQPQLVDTLAIKNTGQHRHTDIPFNFL